MSDARLQQQNIPVTVVSFFNDHVRDLCVYHDSRLKYDQHVSLIVHKAVAYRKHVAY